MPDPKDGIHIDHIDGDAQISQIGGDVQGDIAGRDKNVYHIQNLTVYVSSRPTEPEPSPVSADLGPNPYKGLSAFQETDADHFFGRERVTQALYDTFCALHERPPDGPMPLRLLAILGPSGSGKSSVARAGLLPKLADQPLPGKQRARVAVFTPGTRPLKALATILARIATNDPTPVAKSREMTAELRQGGDGGHSENGLRNIADVLPDIDTQPLLLLIDQFEEVYTKDVEPDERRQFLDNLLCAAADPSGHVSVILTLRSDFLGQTQQHPDFNQAVVDNGVLIRVMNDEELRDAIARPAEQAGHELDDSTVDLLIEQTRDREGVLPLLQFALTRIWDGLAEGTSPAETLKEIGGVGGALAGEAQRLFDQLSDADKAIARRAFLALVQLGEGTQDTRRRISLSEIIAHGEAPDHVQAVVRRFANPQARLVTLSASAEGAETAEVTHEALLDHWATLRGWLDANREDLRFHRHLAADADYWDVQGRPDGKLWRLPDLDLLRQYYERAGANMTPVQVEFFEASVQKEQHSKRVRRMAVAALVVLTVIALGAAGVAWRAYQQSQIRYFVSKAQSLVAYALQDNFQENRERAALLAWQAFRVNQRYEGDIQEEIEEALRTIFRTSEIVEEPGSPVLLDQVCQKVKLKVALTPEEWNHYVGADIPYEPACSELLNADRISLRSELMTAADHQALSLTVNDGGHRTRYVKDFYTNRNEGLDGRFEQQGEAIIDHATDLMWQQSGSDEDLPYAHEQVYDAQDYIKDLNERNFAGHNDWRLPTIEELLSLVEEEQGTVHFFEVTNRSFATLQENNVPESVIKLLEPLVSQRFYAKNAFLDAVRARLGAERAETHAAPILKHASGRNSLYINPIFDYQQWWCWSSDLVQRKDESSPESAWVVNFYVGYVHWNFLDYDYYVRAVRSRQ